MTATDTRPLPKGIWARHAAGVKFVCACHSRCRFYSAGTEAKVRQAIAEHQAQREADRAVKFMVRVKPEQRDRIDIAAGKRNITSGELVRRAIDAYLIQEDRFEAKR